MTRIVLTVLQILLVKHSLGAWQQSYHGSSRNNVVGHHSKRDGPVAPKDSRPGVEEDSKLLSPGRWRRSAGTRSRSNATNMKVHGLDPNKLFFNMPYAFGTDERAEIAYCMNGDIKIPTDGYYLFIQDVKNYGRHCDVLTCSPDASTIYEYPCESVSEKQRTTYFETCAEAKCILGDGFSDYEFM